MYPLARLIIYILHHLFICAPTLSQQTHTPTHTLFNHVRLRLSQVPLPQCVFTMNKTFFHTCAI